jgi:hypothetical protein
MSVSVYGWIFELDGFKGWIDEGSERMPRETGGTILVGRSVDYSGWFWVQGDYIGYV